jgi:hypothetical protein
MGGCAVQVIEPPTYGNVEGFVLTNTGAPVPGVVALIESNDKFPFTATTTTSGQ